MTMKLLHTLIIFFVNVGPSTEKSIPKVLSILPSKFFKERNQVNFVIAHVSNETSFTQ